MPMVGNIVQWLRWSRAQPEPERPLKDPRKRQYNICSSATGGWTLLILALDTTSRSGSVAVVRDGAALAELSGDPAVTHGQRLPGELMRALDSAGVRLDDIDLLAVAAGPGSFTGLRVGIATMQGLAFSRGIGIVPVSTLEAMASEARQVPGHPLIAPWIDAQRGEVFATLYGLDPDAVLVPASSAAPLDTLTAWRAAIGSRRVLFAGDGATRYRAVIESTLGDRARILEPVPRLAAAIGRIAAAEPKRAVAPHAVIPVYVRRSDAELARERGAPR